MIIRPPQKPLLGSLINWGHPLAKYLQKGFIFNERSGLTLRPYLGRHGTNAPLTKRWGNPTWKPEGLYLDDNGHGTENDVMETSFSISNSRSFTFFTTITLKGAPFPSADGAFIFANVWGRMKQNIRNDAGYEYCIESAVGQDEGHRHEGINPNRVYLDIPFTFAVVGRHATNTAFNYVNGTVLELTQMSAGWAGTSDIFSSDYYLGEFNEDWKNYYGLDGIIHHFYLFNKAFSQNELDELRSNPYAMFEQPRKRWFYVAAGGGLSIPVAMADYRQMRN